MRQSYSGKERHVSRMRKNRVPHKKEKHVLNEDEHSWWITQKSRQQFTQDDSTYQTTDAKSLPSDVVSTSTDGYVTDNVTFQTEGEGGSTVASALKQMRQPTVTFESAKRTCSDTYASSSIADDTSENMLKKLLKNVSNNTRETDNPSSCDGASTLCNSTFTSHTPHSASTGHSSSTEDSLRNMHNSASRYLKKKSFDKAVSLFQNIVTSHTSTHGKWHPRVASALHNLSIAKLQAGDLDGSIHSVEEALERRRMSLGEESPKVVESLVQMGIILNARKEWNDALEVLKEALELKEFISNHEPNIEIAKILNNIGCVHYESGDLEPALANLEDALDVQEGLLEDLKCIGPEFLCMASTMCNLAFIFITMAVDHHDNSLSSFSHSSSETYAEGSIDETYRSCSASTDSDERGDGFPIAGCVAALATTNSDGEDTRKNRKSTMSVLRRGKDFETLLQKAVHKLEDALTIQQGLLDEGHHLILNTLDNIAYCHFRLSNYDTSLKYYKRLMKAQKAVLGTQHLDVSATLTKIAKIYLKLCQFEKAHKILDAVTKFYDKNLERDDRRSVYAKALANSVYNHLTPNTRSGSGYSYNFSNVSVKDAMIIGLRRMNLRNPINSRRLNFDFMGELSREFHIIQWQIKKPQNVSKMSGQRISFA
mmetsp:Transcript_9732/g.12639  ORF Transcript_9732/g.12639 Transcript_9732/m.12639 type:complete len:654 (+) Transcript_9732:104-2065(+)